MGAIVFHSLWAVIFSILLLPAVSHGQEEKVIVQFLVFPKSTEEDQFELLVGGDRKIPIQVPTNHLSELYTVDKGKEWVIGSSDVDAQQRPRFTVQGRTDVLDAKIQLVVILRESLDGVDGLRLVAIDCERKGFSGGKCLLVNTTEKDVGGSIGKSQFTLESGSHTTLMPEPSKVKGNRKYLFTKLYLLEDGEKDYFYSSTWRYNANARNIVFFFNEPEAERLKLHIIRDYQ